MFAEFTNDLITGNDMIDSQHKELVEKINDLMVSCENGCDKDEAVKLLQFLSNYTDYHFAAEEALQKELNYPGYEEHAKQHAELTKTVKDLQVILEQENASSDTFKDMVKREILDWFLYHINGYDRSIAEFIFLRDNPNLL